MKNKKSKAYVEGIGATKTARYFESPRVVQWKLEKLNSEGLYKLTGTYQGLIAFRLFYRLLDRVEDYKKVRAMKADVLAEFSTQINEMKYAN